MKKNSILKALGIVFLVYVVLSWIIPIGYFNNGELVTKGTNPVGLFDLIIYPVVTSTSSVFVLTAIIILLIGALYGVLNKTGAYSKILERLVKKFKGKEKNVLICITIIFVLLSSLTGLSLVLLILVPFAATLLLLLGYNKLTTMVSTIGGILVGNIASTYGFNVAGYTSYLTKSINDSILFKILLLVAVTCLLVIGLVKKSKLSKNKIEDIPLYEKNINKKTGTKGIIIPSIIALIVLFIGMVNWNGLFGIELFNNLHDNLSKISVVDKLLGTIPAIGSWTNYEVALVLIIVIFVIGKIYKLSVKEIVQASKEGIKEMLPVAFMAVLANVIFLIMNTNSEGYTIFAPISNYLLGLTKGFNAITLSITSVIGGVLYNDYPYFLSSVYANVAAYKDLSSVGMIAQTIHGLVGLIAPTSVILVAGLTYFDIEYTSWLKKLWKLFLGLLIIIIVIIILVLVF